MKPAFRRSFVVLVLAMLLAAPAPHPVPSRLAAQGKTDPAFAAQDYVSRHVPFEHKADADHLTEGMLMAIRPATG